MSTKAERLALVPKVVAAIKSGKESDIEAVFAHDFKWIVPGTGGRVAQTIAPVPPGIAGAKLAIASLHRAFSDFKLYVLKSIADDDGGENIVATRLEFTGVHTGEWLGVPPTGKSVVGRWASFNRVEGDKVVSGESFIDVAGLLIQLGALPPPKGF